MTRLQSTCLLLLSALTAACGSDPAPVPDAGFADAAVDAGPADSGAPDSGPVQHTLTIDFEGLGGGDVRSSPAGLACIEDCEATFVEGTEVTLTATATFPNVFQGWTGGGCGTDSACTVVLDGDLRISARFDTNFLLSIIPAGDGLGAVDLADGPRCVGRCDLPVLSDTLQVVHAVPAAGVEFVGWTGACSGPDPTCRVGINDDKLIRPLFEVKRPQIAGGGQHFCAIHVQGGLRCWGRGHRGQLGWGSYENLGDDESVGAQGNLQVGFDVAHVSAGAAHSCAMSPEGAVKCWGDNARGQLGQDHRDLVGGQGDPAPADIDPVDLGGVAFQVAAGGEHTCALMADGTVRCWGRGAEGQLGYGDTVDVGDGAGPTPLAAGPVPLGGRAVFVAAGGQHTCAIMEGGGVKCWGSNANGQLGYGFAGNAGDGTGGRATPEALAELELGAPVRRLALGPNHSCATYEDRRVRCWGDNQRGQLGDGSTMQVGGVGGLGLDTAIDVQLGGQDVIEVAVGGAHACASLPNGEVRCWGAGTAGATGQDATVDEPTPPGPLELILGHFPLGIAAAGDASCIATRFGMGSLDYSVLCWGDGQYGGLGTGSTTNIGDVPDSMPPPVNTVF